MQILCRNIKYGIFRKEYQMKISVIMPVYNCKDYLEAAVSSVFAQGEEDIELIAIDDHSTDGSWELLRSLAENEPRIRARSHSTNRGVAAIRNEALALARGDYIAFCDSDDTVPGGAYSSLYNTAVSTEADITVGAFEDVSDSGSQTDCPIPQEAKGNAFLTLYSVCCLWTKLIWREFIEKNSLRFDESMKIGEDVVFLAHAAAAKPKVSHTDTKVYSHIYHDMASTASLTHIYTREAFSAHVDCRRKLLKICADAGIEECPRYVYEYFSGDLEKYLLMIADPTERESAYKEYLDFLSGYDWEAKDKLFRATHGVSYSKMCEMTAAQYSSMQGSILARERVLAEFDAGMIGFRWIIAYFKAWLRFKRQKRK